MVIYICIFSSILSLVEYFESVKSIWKLDITISRHLVIRRIFFMKKKRNVFNFLVETIKVFLCKFGNFLSIIENLRLLYIFMLKYHRE